MRGIRTIFGAGGRRMADRGRAMVVAVAVLLAVALVTGAVVVAKTINGGPQSDVLVGTAKADVINARDGGPDMIDCGGGNDTVYVDRSEDGVVDCETVIAP